MQEMSALIFYLSHLNPRISLAPSVSSLVFFEIVSIIRFSFQLAFLRVNNLLVINTDYPNTHTFLIRALRSNAVFLSWLSIHFRRTERAQTAACLRSLFPSLLNRIVKQRALEKGQETYSFHFLSFVSLF